jgi:hypothetical protein
MVLLAAGVIGLVYVLEQSPRRLAAALKAATLILVLVGLWFSTAKIDNAFTAPGILARLVDGERREATRVVIYGRAFGLVYGAPPGARVAADTSTPFLGAAPRMWYFYPLFGSGLDHHVYPLVGRDVHDLVRHLAARHIQYVVVARQGTNTALAAQAARLGCLHLAAESTTPPARAYTVSPRCREGSHQ